MTCRLPLHLMQGGYPEPVSTHPDDVEQEKRQGVILE